MSFEKLAAIAANPLFELVEAFSADRRVDRMDLGLGVYQNDSGRTPIMQAVSLAERELIADEHTKSYLPPTGDAEFLACQLELLLGSRGVAGEPTRVAALQTPGGS